MPRKSFYWQVGANVVSSVLWGNNTGLRGATEEGQDLPRRQKQCWHSRVSKQNRNGPVVKSIGLLRLLPSIYPSICYRFQPEDLL